MFGIFKRKKKDSPNQNNGTSQDIAAENPISNAQEFVMPIEGEIIPITEVEDPVFSEKMMGDGFAIIPENGSVISPVDGEILNVFPTKHAIGIRAKQGYEFLIHVGLDTVNLKGEGFTSLVQDGDHVTKGQEILKFELDFIKKNARSSVIPVIFTDSTKIEISKWGKTKQGEADILSIEK